MRSRVTREEGQVYPALLLAVIGGFAIAVTFIALQNLLDQTGRADTAADAAALAVAAEHKDHVETMMKLESVFGTGGTLTTFLQSIGSAPGVQIAAREYADANGAEVDGLVSFRGYDPVKREWIYEVTTRQLDTVKGGDAEARSKSRSKVSVSISGGLCSDLSGFMIGGSCIGATEFLKSCVEPPPPPPAPDPTPSDPPKPGDPEESEKPDKPDKPDPFVPAGFCGTNVGDLLQWDIHLIQ